MGNSNVFKRNAGILMAISSLPSPYGIGTLGKDAYEFVDFVRDSNHKYWQDQQHTVTVLISHIRRLRVILILSIWIC